MKYFRKPRFPLSLVCKAIAEWFWFIFFIFWLMTYVLWLPLHAFSFGSFNGLLLFTDVGTWILKRT